MSWFSKVGLFLAPVICTATASAARIQFHGTDAKATLDARPLVSNSEVSPVEIRLSIPAIDVDQTNDGFNDIRVNGLTPNEIVGNPALLGTGSLVAVPAGYEAKLEIVSQDTRDVENVIARPAQRQMRCEFGTLAPQFNSALYKSNVVYPLNVAELKEVGSLQGLRLMRVAINPIQQDLGRGSLRVTTDLVARVSFTKTANAAPVRLSKTFFRIARSMTVNGQAIGRTVVTTAGAEKMLIVTAEALKPAIAPLVTWKRSRGLDVDVVTYAEAGGTKEKVKEYIQKYYDTATVKPTYLVVVGNKTTAPAFMESTGAGSAASDYRFALLTGGDNIPDMLYGRVLADNADEATRQINRWVSYEKSPEKSGGWYSKGLTIASNEGSGPSDKEYAEQVREALKKGTYTDFDVLLQGDKNATPENIDKGLNDGRTWIAYFGHGSGTSWGSTNGTYGNTQITKLANGDKLPVIIDVACLNASWVSLSKPMGKAFVTHTSNGKEAGAAAFYGGSVSISWHPPAVMSVGIAKAHFEKPINNLGGSLLAGQLYLIEKMGTGSDTMDNLKWYNLFGDPSALVRTATPKAYNVKTQVREENGDTVVKIVATDKDNKGVAGLTASLANGDAALAVARTDANGAATLTVKGNAKDAGLTVTGYNAETYQAELN